jgi:hypothetical protein
MVTEEFRPWPTPLPLTIGAMFVIEPAQLISNPARPKTILCKWPAI